MSSEQLEYYRVRKQVLEALQALYKLPIPRSDDDWEVLAELRVALRSAVRDIETYVGEL